MTDYARIVIDPEYKIDARPVRYAPPMSAVSELVQRPAIQITAEALSSAYMRDWRRSRAARITEAGKAALEGGE